MKLWIVAAVESELDRLKHELHAGAGDTVAGYRYYRSTVGSVEVYLGETGVGVVSAAVAISAFACAIGADRMIMIGSAGSYPGSGLSHGDVVAASSEALAELGVCSGHGVGDSQLLGMAFTKQRISMHAPLSEALARACSTDRGTGLGAFLTVAGASGSPEVARRREGQFGALVENMEGYALSLAGKKLGIEVGELRAISNSAGNRDKSTWHLDLANERAQDAVLTYLRRIV